MHDIAAWVDSATGLLKFKPNAVVGHSCGEIAAAYAAGYMSLRDAIVTVYHRGLAVESLWADWEDVLKRFRVCCQA